MVTRSAAREASETWHIRLRLASHASSVMAINLTCARVNNNGRRANGVGKKKGEFTVAGVLKRNHGNHS